MPQPFNASNKPGTCPWCGRKLKANRTSWVDGKFIERWQDRPLDGSYGYDGIFDTGSCGYMFGRAMAKAGKRLRPKEA